MPVRIGIDARRDPRRCCAPCLPPARPCARRFGTFRSRRKCSSTFDWRLLEGGFYLGFELALDVFGLLLLAGLLLALWRRYVQRPARLTRHPRFAYALAMLTFLVLTGYALEALRLAATQPPWAPWSPVGWAIARGLLAAGASEPALRAWHLALWLAHAAAAFVFIAALPWTYFTHLAATPLNIFFAKLGSTASLPKIENIEEQERFGVSRFEQFSWKRRLDFDACTECGRCQAVCCAQLSGSVLNPKEIVGKLRRYMHEGGGKTIEGRALHGDTITADELWACTTCGACIAECPARIDIIDTIVDLRRHLALEQGAFPHSAGSMLHATQRLHNPWGLDPADRWDWTWDLDVPRLEPGKPVEVLYWVGCAASFDQRAQNIARSMVHILKAAGVGFAVMTEERCHAEVGRRLGEEYLYQTATEENIAALRQYSFGKIVAACPHCFNTLRNEYPKFAGGTFDVVHHSTFIAQLIQQGRLKLALQAQREIAYHDPCYLGRHNGEFDAPRAVLAAVPGVNLVELPQRRQHAVCCGGGGGQMWMEGKVRKRVNIIRAEQLAASGAATAAVACPFCLSMLDDARKSIGAEETFRLRDIAEIVAEALGH